MQSRPWPLILLAVLHFFSFIPNIAYASWRQHMGLNEYLYYFLKDGEWVTLFKIFGAPMLMGLSIYAMKKWSYWVYLALLSWISYRTYLSWAEFPNLFQWPVLIFAYVLNLAVVSYFLIPAVRLTYFDSRVRWWESQERYQVNLPVQIVGYDAKATITDISRGGVFVETTSTFSLDSSVRIEFEAYGHQYSIESKVSHQGQNKKSLAQGYGIQFVETLGKQKLNKALKKQVTLLLKQIRASGAPLCTPKINPVHDFIRWGLTAFKTGKGLIPSFQKKR